MDRVRKAFSSLSFLHYLFMAALGVCCYVWVFSSCGKKGLLLSCSARAPHRHASPVVELRFQGDGLQ